MFGFTRRKVHSNNRKKEKSKEPREHPQQQQQQQQRPTTVPHAPAVATAPSPPASPPTPDPYEYSFDDLSSVDDMSLYTSESKSTVRYPPQLLNYGMGEGYEDSHDGISCAPSEFTTEIAMKHYARLGGAWRPHQTTPLPHDDGSPPPRNDRTMPPPQQTHEQERSLIRRRPMDEESVAVASVLPATAKMARITLRDNVYANANPLRAPVDLDDSVADSESARSLFDSPLRDSPPHRASPALPISDHSITNSKSRTAKDEPMAAPTTVRRSNTGPVDLDVSVADSESVLSLLDSPLRSTPAPPMTNISKIRRMPNEDASVLSISLPVSLSAEDATDDGSLTFSPSPLNELSIHDEEDTYGFSVDSELHSAGSARSNAAKRLPDKRTELFQGELDDSFPSSDGSKDSTKRRAKQNDESTMSMQYSIDSNRTPLVASSPLHGSKPAIYSLETAMTRTLSKFQSERTPTSSKKGAPNSLEERPTSQRPSPSTISSRSARGDWANKIQARPPPQTKLARWTTTSPTTTTVKTTALSPTTSALASRDQATSQLKPKTVQASSMVVEPDCGQSVVSALTAAAALDELDDDTYGYSTSSATLIPQLPNQDPVKKMSPLSSPPILVEDDEPVVWTDQREDERQTATDPKQEIRDDVLDRTYQETMDTISFARRSHEFTSLSEDNEEKEEQNRLSTGAVLLTETELRKHLKKVQHAQPLPLSEIQGYDSWKQQMEQRQKYFAKLQAQAARQELLKMKNSQQMKRGFNTPGHGKDRPVNSTRSAMDRSIDSSIPTIDDGKVKPRRKNGSVPRSSRSWGWFQLDKKRQDKVEKKKSTTTKTTKSKNSSSQSTDKTKKPKKSSERKTTESAVVPLSQFMRISADEMSQKNPRYSPPPILKSNVKPLPTSALHQQNRADPTKSHRDNDDYGVGTRRLVASLRLDEYRNPRNLSNTAKDSEEERMARLRQEAIQNQRQLRHKEIERLSTQAEMMNKSRTQDLVVRNQGSGRSSGPAKLLAPCVVCKASERSHIAMPCMHFSFCKNCIDDLSQSARPQCPVCSVRNVTFTRVYTG